MTADLVRDSIQSWIVAQFDHDMTEMSKASLQNPVLCKNISDMVCLFPVTDPLLAVFSLTDTDYRLH